MIDPSAATEFFRGYRRGRYHIEKVVGIGGMGTVFLAGDSQLERYVAIKILNPDMLDRAEITSRFEREAKIMTKIVHPAIVQVYDTDMIDDLIPCIFLEWVDGGSLWGYVQTHGAMNPAMAVYIMTLVCEGIEFAHAQGVIHRDIKPDNILLDPDGYPKITDFGIALMQQDDGDTRMTQAGVMMGSTGFMAPEQMHNASEVTVRADVHGLGVTLWSILKNKLPCSFFAAAIMAADTDLLDGISDDLKWIIRKAAHVNQTDRYATVAEFRQALQDLLDSRSLDTNDAFDASSSCVLPVPNGGERLKYHKPIDLPELPSTRVARSIPVVPMQVPAGVETLLRQQDGGADFSSETQFGFVMEEVKRRNRVRIGIMVGVAALLIGGFVGFLFSDSDSDKESKHPITQPLEIVSTPSESVDPVSIPEPIVRVPLSRRPAEYLVTAHARLGLEEKISMTVAEVGSTAPKPRTHETHVAEVKAPVISIKTKKQPQNTTQQTDVVKDPKKDPGETTIPISPVDAVVVEKTRVSVSFPDGESFRVWLSGSGGRYHLPSSVVPGTYKVIGAFPSGERTAISSLVIEAGKTVKLTCTSSFGKCVVR